MKSSAWRLPDGKWFAGLAGAFLLFLSMSAQADGRALHIGGTGATYGLMPLLAKEFAKRKAGVTFHFPKSLGSGGGIRALLAGPIDIATTARPLKPKEQGKGLTVTPLAKTPVAFVTSRPETNLIVSATDLVAIFALERRYWPDGVPIRIILRPADETDTVIVSQTVRGFDEAVEKVRQRDTIPTASTDQENLDMAEGAPNSLAVSALLAVKSEGRNLRVVALDRVAPTVRNLANGTYPLVKSLYVVTRSDAPPVVREFLGFLRSSAARAIIEAHGGLPSG